MNKTQKKMTNIKRINSDTPYNRSELIIPPRIEEINNCDRGFNYDKGTNYEKSELNPFKTQFLTQYVNVDTRFRPNIFSSKCQDFTFTLHAPIKKVVSMKLASYEFPICFYGISKSYGNNFVNISCTYIFESNYITSKRILIVPDGNYAATDLLDTLNALLSPVDSVSGLLVYNSPDLTTGSIFNYLHFDLDTTANGSGSGKVFFKITDQTLNITSINMDFTLDINGIKDKIPLTSKLGSSLGFIQENYYGLTKYISDTIPDSGAMRYIYLAVNDFNNSASNTYISAFSNWGNNNILARIPINGQFFHILMDNDLSQHLEPRQYFGPVDIQKLQIQILDDHGRILDMNNSNYTFVLVFKTLYD
jgi:hypothetical protein